MNNKERIFHAVLFEALALAIIIPIASLATGSGSVQLMIVGVGMSAFTVVWNYIYNHWFDKYVSGVRSERTVGIRVVHALGFEAGLILFTIPAIAWFLKVSLLTALLIEAGFLMFFFFYTTGFNWLYDRWQPYQRLLARVGRRGDIQPL
ncbi:PACE efflux transporter [Vibrio hangzhouensis]|uniref:PACE efflux transporter n=1 Tax=Vibrio hangzhouensis TaxID=462991 RepID=UPI001C952FB1|nr:PACE efflux transporter [Vibrio hangzhouensis]MBY6197866.1 PACE efflux transporter [Vibrio hangzhouensis]